MACIREYALDKFQIKGELRIRSLINMRINFKCELLVFSAYIDVVGTE